MARSNDEILEACRRGDLKAISLVIYKTLEKNNIWSAILLEDGILNIHLESKSNVNKEKIISWLKNFLGKLEIKQIKECHVDFSSSGIEQSDWTESFSLSSDSSGDDVDTKESEVVEVKVPAHGKKITSDAVQQKSNVYQTHEKKGSITKSTSSRSNVKTVLSGVVLVSVVGAIFFVGTRFIYQKDRENPVLSDFLEDMMPYRRDVVGGSKNLCTRDYTVSQIIQDPSLCPIFDEDLENFCDDYPEDGACHASSLEEFCRENPYDVICAE